MSATRVSRAWTSRAIRFLPVLALWLAATPAPAMEYSAPPGIVISAISMELKDPGPVCVLKITLRNGTDKDQALEVVVETDEGYAVTTYTGGPRKTPLKANASETIELPTVLRRLPKDLTVAVAPLAN
ncbi:MAG: hypothetical protein HY521_01655 [Proteobacteria bacterium]|nr:hypothetical protein [Pseudomonadota bacterium]